MSSNLASQNEAITFLNSLKDKGFKVIRVTKKPGKRTPSAPFITSTLQQEASRVLGFSVSRTMSVAQRLYESGHITYMRTDSVSLSKDAMSSAQQQITRSFGSHYCNPRKYQNKNKSAQEAHEAIRPTNFGLSSLDNDSPEDKLYKLIWRKTIASQMSDAEIEKTTIEIGFEGISQNFLSTGEVIKFDGFLKVYNSSSGKEGQSILPNVNDGDLVNCIDVIAIQKFSRPPARYTEASLVKKLEDLGIGRPSTYAPTIKTVQDRGYVEIKDLEGVDRDIIQIEFASGEIKKNNLTEKAGADRKKMMPTTIGEVVNDFLSEHFQKIMDYNFTADIEKELDAIADGSLTWSDMLGKFYKPFHKNVTYIQENAERANGERLLGNDPKSGDPVFAKLGKYGPIIQIGDTKDEDKKPRFASLKSDQNIKTIDLESALSLFEFPKLLGTFENDEVYLKLGRFGPYIQFGKTNVSIEKGDDVDQIDLEKATIYIRKKKELDAPIMIYEDLPVTKGKGRFGPFIKWNDTFINVNKKYDFDQLSDEDIVELIEEKKKKDKEKLVHHWEAEGITVEKGRWGKFFVISGKKRRQLDAKKDPKSVTLEEAKSILKS